MPPDAFLEPRKFDPQSWSCLVVRNCTNIQYSGATRHDTAVYQMKYLKALVMTLTINLDDCSGCMVDHACRPAEASFIERATYANLTTLSPFVSDCDGRAEGQRLKATFDDHTAFFRGT